MNRLHLLFALLIATVALFAIDGNTPVQARALQPASNCSMSTLTGSYDILSSPTVPIGQGTTISIPDSIYALSPVPFAAKGTLTFEGAGDLWIEVVGQGPEAVAATTLYGAIVGVDSCTLLVEFENGRELGIRIVTTRSEQFPVSTTPGFVILRTPAPYMAN